MTKPKTIRCAIYTRKSSEEGLEQAYNSLDAQRDACAAYIQSQAGEGWELLPECYDDGGFSGGNIERPGLKRLMAQIQAGKVDVVVVYKVDRLTRSLSDFAKIVDVLDRQGASFVSVTQAFNTTTSMGRLTLNVLLSFAQFEREVTGERIRDKIAASKRLGMWMGGTVPLGYRSEGRSLQIEPAEADTVRMIFQRYLDLGSVHSLAHSLAADGVVSKTTALKDGTLRGGCPLNRGALYHLLRNQTYLGRIKHKGQTFKGLHPAIIDEATFKAVALKLDETAKQIRLGHEGQVVSALIHRGAPLTGLIFDTAGNAMSPVQAKKPGGATYRYYVSRALQTGAPERVGALGRVAAVLVEELILERFSRWGLGQARDLSPDWAMLRGYIHRLIVAPDGIKLTLTSDAIERLGGLAQIQERLGSDDDLTADASDDQVTVKLDLRLLRQGGVTRAINPAGGSAIDQPRRDQALTSALIRAEAWKRRLLKGEVATVNHLAQTEGVTANYISRILRTAFLAPDLKASILQGRQPPALTLQAIMTGDLPLDWQAQRQIYWL
jgi:site-specific DNA recombinase